MRQSQDLKPTRSRAREALQLRFGCGELPGGHGIGKSGGLVRAIAERLVGGVAAAAKADDRTTRQAEGLSLRVENFEIAFDAYGSVVIDRNFRCRHIFS